MQFNLKKLLLYLWILFFINMGINPQINIEKLRDEKKDQGFRGIFDITLNLNAGNTKLLEVDSELKFLFSRGKNHFLLAGDLKYGKEDSESFINQGFIHLRGIRELSEKLKAEVFLQDGFNHFILLENRFLAGGGLQFLIKNSENTKKTKNLSVKLGIGLMFEKEVFTEAEDGSLKDDTSLLRSTNYLSFNFIILDKLNFAITSYFQFDPGNLNSYRLLSDINLEFQINKHFAYKSELNFRYDNTPPGTIEKFDLNFSNGFSFSF